MELFKYNGVFIAKTNFGEWDAKQAGFTWDKMTKTWKTTDLKKAVALAQKTGLTFSEVVSSTPQEAPQTPTDLWPTIHEGRYALAFYDQFQNQTVKFYAVDKPKEGKWAGYTFLNALASDTRHPIRKHEDKKLILDRIAENPIAAMQFYGQHIGCCGYCGRSLTDELSRHIGIGPICRGKLGVAGE